MSTPVSNPVLGTASESAMALNDKVNELKTLCEGFKGKEGSDEKLLTTLTSSYDAVVASLHELFAALPKEVITDSGLFSRDTWNSTLAEVCRLAIENVARNKGANKALEEEINIVKTKDSNLRTVIDAVVQK